ncbi:adenylate cyclase [Labrenzia sp. EL_208]|uniref:Adenylate cyclase 1 n=1 Tax=Roseibium album TaxID=311410 RepID=A0A0M7AT08_9HYPH|nr:adenylate/guanylate cyclase domain-containing protein [Roseibium album]MBG6146340.1 adenylate cyclase [Labrenzia sp. EL_142]MBG6154803.1 adenylate cyclase [Labrenzia sp. EL_162]MBG6162060.1 adenylate cyclase [Labrenzia sp. EL_195]MBG6174221.1 adenylate cyclase [Labrenzia sp. EL_132]MBG6193067.1 adenylate cyclase [Labrenzia sp. EL_159]MBG6228323.1 adenylate cyclase [Labrenzia sp. EL_208]MCR9057850.1 adenylate/guanylate cyclase domain-containing protein [Paracoccaceae bacterium]
MNRQVLDPAPRSYVQHIYLLARSNRGAACAPDTQNLQDVHDWLLHDATRIDNVMLMFEEFMWRCRAANLGIDRCTLHIGTLHPRVVGFSWVWNSTDELCDEIAADANAVNNVAFTKNPLYRVMREGEIIKVDLETEEGVNSGSLMQDLAEQGYTAYVALPLSTAGEMHNAMTFATKRPGGFPPVDKERIRGLIDLLALHVERHIVQRIARNVADTYLGPIAGRRVLDGEIRRGDGEAIKAVVFMSDMRGFTQLADRLSGPEVTCILNAYFDRVSDAVLNHGGDILKFMGDGILAVFDQEVLGEKAAAEAAVKASREALSAIDELNDTPPATLPDPDLWQPLKIGIGLHRGEVFFGNVGGEDRLDFTVIGRAVNETSRVESLCKPLGQELLMTAPVKEALSGDLQTGLNEMGEHALRGVGKPVAIFAA